MNGTATIQKLLVDSEKHRHELAARADKIRRAALAIEKSAISESRQLRKRLRSATGDRRKILEAEYLAAVDRRQKASKAYTLATRTLAKLGRAV